MALRAKLRDLLTKAGLVTAALLLALGGLEIVLRVSGVQPDFFVQLDPQVSVTYIPGKKGWKVFPSGRQWLEINSHGYRDREWALDKPPDTVRIAFLGDSYVAALEVPPAQRASELFEARLNAECDRERRFEVLNFGVTGYGTAQTLDTLRHRLPRFAPDAVVAFFYTGNDLFNNSVELDPEPNRVHYELDASGELVRLPYAIRDNAVKRWLRANSKAYLFVRTRLKRLAAVHEAMMKLGVMQQVKRGRNERAVIERLRGLQHLRRSPPVIDRAWELTEALLAAVARQARDAGIGLQLVIIPTRNQLLDAAGRLPSDPAEWDLQQPVRRLRGICDRLALDCLSLVEPMSARQGRIEALFFDPGGHWTPAGHRLAADAVFDFAGARFCAD